MIVFKKTLVIGSLFLCFSFYAGTIPFVTTWETTNLNESITIPTEGGGYNYSVDWGDGTITNEVMGATTHIYSKAGLYTVVITGSFPQIFFNNSGDKDKIKTIEQWGDNLWTSFESAFHGCTNLNIINPNIDIPNLSNVTHVISMFEDAVLFNYDISNWDVSNITNMNRMFFGANSFDQNIGNWNVEKLQKAEQMFENATLSIDNYDALLIGWNNQSIRSNITFSGGNSQYCLGEQARVDIININNWDVFDAGKAGPIIDNLDTQTEMGSFVFPEITGSLLTGNEAYYEGPNGTGTIYTQGDVVNYDVSEVYPLTLYIYDGSAICADEVFFELTLTEFCVLPIIDPVNQPTEENVNSYIFPKITGKNLTGNEAYYTEPGGAGIRYFEGDVINFNASENYPIIFYVYDGSVNCNDDKSFELTLNEEIICAQPNADVIMVDTVCNEYILPALSIGNFYYTESRAMGNQLFPGDIIRESQLIYIYTGVLDICFDENNFFVNVDNCEKMKLIPDFFTPNNDGFNDLLIANNPNDLDGSVFIYDRFGKLLFQFLLDDEQGWDGTFGGREMPTSTYWYHVKTINEDIKGHFVLKR